MDASDEAGAYGVLSQIVSKSQQEMTEPFSLALSALAQSDTERARKLLAECSESIRKSGLELRNVARNSGMKALGMVFDRMLKEAAGEVAKLIASLDTAQTVGDISSTRTVDSGNGVDVSADTVTTIPTRQRLEGKQSKRRGKKARGGESEEAKSRWNNPRLKLSKAQREAVIEFMEKRDGAKPLEVAQWYMSEYSELITERLPQWYPGHSEEEYTAQALHDWINISLVDRGIARRLALDNPAELAAHASLAGRLNWMNSYRRNNESDYFPQVWEILRALGGGDIVIAKRYAETSRFPIAKGHPEVVPLYNGVLAVLRNDIEYLRSLVPILQKRKATLWVGATYPCLIGIAQGDPRLVAEGLDKMFRTCGRRQVYPSILEKTIYLELHGFFELCRWVSPSLVSEFDVDRPFPWDRECFQFVRTCDDPAKIIRLEGISPELHRWVMTLPRPYWWD
jgi:hypothetical protein